MALAYVLQDLLDLSARRLLAAGLCNFAADTGIVTRRSHAFATTVGAAKCATKRRCVKNHAAVRVDVLDSPTSNVNASIRSGGLRVANSTAHRVASMAAVALAHALVTTSVANATTAFLDKIAVLSPCHPFALTACMESVYWTILLDVNVTKVGAAPSAIS